MGGWVSTASRLCWSLHPKGSTNFSTRVQWRACASHTGGANMFLPKINAWNLIMNPFGKGKASTPNHQLLGFQLSIFVGMLISGMCLGRIGMFPLRNHGDFLFWGRFFGIGCLLSCDFCLEFQKRIWPRVLTTRFAFFVGGLGREFCLLVPPFPRWAWFEKSKRPWNDTVEAEKSLGCKRQIHLVYNPYLPQAICLKSIYLVPSLGWVFYSPLPTRVGFFSIFPFPAGPAFAPKKIRWRKLPDVNCRASGGSWVDGLMDGWLVPGISKNAWKSGLLVLKPSEIRRWKKTVEVAGFFFASAAMVWCGEWGWWKMFMFDKNSLLYYFWKLRLWGKVDESEREILSDGWLQVEGRILLLNTW